MINWETVLSVMVAIVFFQFLTIIIRGCKAAKIAAIPATGPWKSMDNQPPLRKDVLLRIGDTYRVGWRDDYYHYSVTGCGSFSAERITAWAELNKE